MKIIKSSTLDSELIARIIRNANADVAEEFGINADNNPKHPSFCNKDWVEADFERGEEYFLYVDGNNTIGCVAFESPNPDVAYLNRLSVLPEYRQNGVAEELVRYIFDYAKSKTIPKVSIGIIAEHTRLKNWYLKLGFVEGEVKKFPHLPFDVQFLSIEI